MQRLTMRGRSGRGQKPPERSITLDKSTIIGSGGEGVVHRDPDHPRSGAIKIYKEPSLARANKLAWFMQHGLKQNERIAAPRELAYDSRDNVVGFGMPQLSRRYEKLSVLFDGTYCDDNKITSTFVADLFLGIGDDLTVIHGDCGVGDLNDGTVLFTPGDPKPAWVDVDSWDVQGFPCVVGTQLYLCPALYGIDLASGPHFERWHDDFSFAVLLFRALLRKHPFKAGIHPKLRSILQRAQAGVTVLDSSVAYPPQGLKPEVLTDDLADALVKQLKLQNKGAFPLAVLRRYREQLTECPSCGVHYPRSRKVCPQCSSITIAQVATALGVTVEDLLSGIGRIVHMQFQGTTLICITDEHGTLTLHRKPKTGPAEHIPLGIGHAAGMRYGLFKDVLVIANDNGADDTVAPLYLLELGAQGVRPVKQLTTNIFSGKAPVFATSRRYLYRLAGNWLLRGERFGSTGISEETVCDVFQNQSWFTCDPDPTGGEVVFGMNRDIGIVHWFLSTSDDDGKRFETRPVKVPQLDSHESLVDLAVRFDGRRVLLVRRTRKAGHECVRIEQIGVPTGEVVFSTALPLTDHPHWDRIQGIAVRGNVVMIPTDHGIVRVKLDTADAQTLGGTQPAASADSVLHVYGDSILVKGHNTVSLIKKS